MAISRVHEIEEQTDGQPSRPVPVRAPGYGAQTILVVDDDPFVRAFISELLGLEGYVVVEAGGTAEALRISAGHPGLIDLVISDVVMADGDDGRDLVKQLGRTRPTIKALYISGHPEAAIARGGALLSAAFLPKPFTMAMLIEKVWAVLDPAEARIARV